MTLEALAMAKENAGHISHQSRGAACTLHASTNERVV